MSASVQVYRLRVIPASGTPDLPPSVEALFHQPFTQKELLYMLAAAGRLPGNYAAAMTSSAAQADFGDKATSAALCCKGLPSPVPFDRILYATSDGHYTLITCGPPARTIRVRASFSGILERLSDTRFLSQKPPTRSAWMTGLFSPYAEAAGGSSLPDIKLIKTPAGHTLLDADRRDYLLFPRLIGPVCLHGRDPVRRTLRRGAAHPDA